jgi:dTDP-4-amino-4,6-dideoxygalactose transaminase
MDELLKICKKNNIDIIEDATESLGSEYKGKKIGSFGAAGCFSFNGNKIITTGGGGMVVTNNNSIAKKIKHLSTQAKKDNFEYDHDAIGYNYRLSNMQAAMGLAQMERIEDFVNIKRENASIYSGLMSEVKGVKFLWEDAQVKSNFWFYTIKVAKRHKKKLINYLLSKNIQVRPVWKLIHTLPMYKGAQTYKIENAVRAYETCINLPCSLSLGKKEIEYVAQNIGDYFSGQ